MNVKTGFAIYKEIFEEANSNKEVELRYLEYVSIISLRAWVENNYPKNRRLLELLKELK